jgi:hypothetical protein
LWKDLEEQMFGKRSNESYAICKCKRVVVRYAKGEAIQMEVPRMLKMIDARINTLSRDVQGAA